MQHQGKMSDPANFPFGKYHGAGNDFVIFDGRYGLPVSEYKLAKAICNRRLGIGADGLIVVDASTTDDYAMRYYNSDGTRTVCGNGMRVAAHFLVSLGLLAPTQKRFQLETENGSVRIDILGKGERSRVSIGAPQFDGRYIPCAEEGEHFDKVFNLSEGSVTLSAVGMGNPHAVIFVEDVDCADVESIGRELEHHPFFPNRTNVEFAEVVRRDQVKMRVWERGVGETLACGTGNCAILAAGVKTRRLDRLVHIEAPGGDFELVWADENQSILMTGPSEEVFTGYIDLVKLLENYEARSKKRVVR